MASTQAKQGQAIKPHPPKAKKTIKFPLIYLGIIGIVSFLSIPGGILVVGGTMPTIATWLSDRAPGKPFGLSVGLMNMGAVVLFLIRVLPYGHNFDKAMVIVGSGVTWLMIYMFAFLGWGIYFGLPVLIQRYLTSQVHKKVERVRSCQQDLIAAWGKDVATSGKSLVD